MVFGFKLGKPLSEAQLRNLKDHRYAAAGTTLLDPIMQPFWRYAVNYIPLWMAPNLITVIGLFLNVVSASIMFIYAPDTESEVPAWVHVLCAVCLFAYQTLDALDGKQARRTGSSSPLGELFDHGCDAVSTVFVILSACISGGLGPQRFLTFVVAMYAYATYYGAHWETYVTGHLQFHKIDVTEGHWAVIFLYLVTAVFGSSFWQTTFTIPLLGTTMAFNHLVVLTVVGSASWMWIQNFIIFASGGVGKNGSTVADTSVAFPIVPLALICGAAHVINAKSNGLLLNDAPVVYIVLFGFIFAKASSRLIVAHMSRWEFQLMDTSLIGPILLSLNQYFNEPINDHLLLHFCLIFTLADFLYYAASVCVQIAQHLNIEVFRIQPVLSATQHEAVNGAASNSNSNSSGRKVSSRGQATNGTTKERARRANTRKQSSLHD